jgi:hypothetical protein
MKRIGTSEADGPIIEIDPLEVIEVAVALDKVLKLLEPCPLPPELQAPRPAVSAEKAPSATPKIAPEPATRSKAAAPERTASGTDRNKRCSVCGRAFYDDSRTNVRRFCGKGECRRDDGRIPGAERPVGRDGRVARVGAQE